MIENHVGFDNISEKTAEHNHRNAEKGNGFKLSVQEWDKPSGTIDGHTGHGSTANVHPGTLGGFNAMQKPLLDSLPKLPSSGLTAVSLFSGGGLMDLGVIHAGIDVVWANDFEKTACVAYAHNIGGHIHHGDITQNTMDKIPSADIVIGGPSCQSWSIAGKGEGDKDPRGQMIWAYLHIITAKKPKAFMFENVKGIITKKHKPIFDSFIAKLEDIGYNVTWKVVNAWDYGVAQKRERIFAVGIRKDLGFTYVFPKGEYETTGYRPVLRDAIGDLPEPFTTAPDINAHTVIESMIVKPNTYNQRNYAAEWDEPARTVCTNRLDHAEIHPGPQNHTERDYFYPKDGRYYKFRIANRIQDMDKPCETIPAHKGSGQPIHPIQKPRRFTVREALRIQSVPDSYVFPEHVITERETKLGKRLDKKKFSLSAMYKVVGNGVASRVAYHLAKALREQLGGARPEQQQIALDLWTSR